MTRGCRSRSSSRLQPRSAGTQGAGEATNAPGKGAALGSPHCSPGPHRAGAAVCGKGDARLHHGWGPLTCRAATCQALQPWMVR